MTRWVVNANFADVYKNFRVLTVPTRVPRDLAARNVLVDKNNRCKIADFGERGCQLFMNIL